MANDKVRDITIQLANQPGNTTLYLKRGRLFLEDGRYKGTTTDFKNALDMDPTVISVHYFLGGTHLRLKNVHVDLKYTHTFLTPTDIDNIGA